LKTLNGFAVGGKIAALKTPQRKISENHQVPGLFHGEENHFMTICLRMPYGAIEPINTIHLPTKPSLGAVCELSFLQIL